MVTGFDVHVPHEEAVGCEDVLRACACEFAPRRAAPHVYDALDVRGARVIEWNVVGYEQGDLPRRNESGGSEGRQASGRVADEDDRRARGKYAALFRPVQDTRRNVPVAEVVGKRMQAPRTDWSGEAREEECVEKEHAVTNLRLRSRLRRMCMVRTCR